MAPQNFVFGLIGLEDLYIGGGTFSVTLPNGVTTDFNKIGSHSFLDAVRNPLQNGAVGNGTTDDRAALNTLANTTLQSGGGVIYFPSGYTFRISSNITFPSNVELVFGPGAVLSIDVAVVVTINGFVSAPSASFATGSGTVSYGAGARKAVFGPSSATDNAFARFDTTTGRLLQNSAVTADDSGNVGAASVTTTNYLATLTGQVFFTGTGAGDILLRNSGDQLLCRLGNDGDYAGFLAQFLVAVNGAVYYGPANSGHTQLLGVGTTLFCKLGDNSAYATFDAGAYKVGGVAGVSFSGATITTLTVVNGLVTGHT